MIVTTKLGRLEGEDLGRVAVFRAIPYAAPPVGELRFRAPEPPAPWPFVRDARAPGPSSPQLQSIIRDLPPQDEDCLHLNVWTPAFARGARRSPLPVMVFVHGGGFVSGASTHVMYDGAELAAHGDVVVVSFNYRLGALGFADLAALDAPGFAADANNGLRDQLAALRFVQEHIDAFGGDPGQVTLFGQSAGAMCVATLLTLDAARGLFGRAIAQSGAAHHVTSREHSARIARCLVDALELGPRDLSRIRELPAAAIVKAQAACLRQWVDVGSKDRPLHNANMTLLPVVDGELVPELPIEAAARGKGGDVPLLLGVNRDEWHFWVFLTDVSKRDLDEPGLARVLERRVPAARTAEASALYQAELSAELGRAPAVWEKYSAIETDRIFTIPAQRLSHARARGPAPTFVYRFDQASPLFDGELGACHTLEVPFVLGTTDGPFGSVFTGGGEGARALSLRVMEAWLAFARSGDPSCEGFGAFPRYEPADRLALAVRPEHALLRFPSDARLQFWADLL